jgi:uncharacterized protein with GYD domain
LTDVTREQEAAMATYVMFGNYSLKGIKKASAVRTDEAREIIEAHGGKLKEAYALLGSVDLVVLVELPDTASAMQASLELSRLTGISFTTAPALPVAEFDALLED